MDDAQLLSTYDDHHLAADPHIAGLRAVRDAAVREALDAQAAQEARRRALDELAEINRALGLDYMQPSAQPAPEPVATPEWWRTGLAATLMREGINKHIARKIADGYWQAYCKIDEKK